MSHTQVQWARGTSAQVASYTGPAGEVVVDTDDYSLAVQDGLTAGGFARLTPGLLPPQGRLTLTSGAPVMAADVTAATTLYYTPYIGRWCPIYNGAVWQQAAFIETTLPLDSNSADTGYQQSGKLFDIFGFLTSGSFTLGTGPAWSSTTARGSGAGTTQLQMQNGVWTNANSITLRTGAGSGATVTAAANQATYLGTMYATANGQTAMQFAPAAAAGGSAAMMALYNAYNRVALKSQSQDNTASWTYSGSAWRAADGSSGNAVGFVDGLAQSCSEASYFVATKVGTTGQTGLIGIDFNSTSGAPPAAVIAGGAPSNGPTPASVTARFGPALGWNIVTAMESGNSASGVTFYGAGLSVTGGLAGQQTQCLYVRVEM